MLKTVLNWLKSLFAAPRRGESIDLFDPEETMIYTHLMGYDHKGEKLFANKDPMRLWQRLMEHAQSLDDDLKVARSPISGAADRYKSALNRLRYVFEVKTPEEGGLPDAMVLKLYGHYVSYTNTLKKTTQPTATSVPATSAATTPSAATEKAPPPPTETTSASGSTATAACTDSPTPSASAPA